MKFPVSYYFDINYSFKNSTEKRGYFDIFVEINATNK